jgi:uncharacterized DUF497 family protein
MLITTSWLWCVYVCILYLRRIAAHGETATPPAIQKHHVGFEEATDVFYDERRVELFDEEHSEDQGRYSIIGFSNKARLLFVSYVPMPGDRIHLIHARVAETEHEQLYEEYNR